MTKRPTKLNWAALLNKKLMGKLIMAACCVVLVTHVAAQSMTEIPTSWSDVDQTRELEQLVHDVVETDNEAVLSIARARITAVDQVGIERIVRMIDESETEALNSLSLKMSACHHAGMLIRLLILDLSEAARVSGSGDYSISDSNAAHFAENMDRCERLSGRSVSPRLIGGIH